MCQIRMEIAGLFAAVGVCFVAADSRGAVTAEEVIERLIARRNSFHEGVVNFTELRFVTSEDGYQDVRARVLALGAGDDVATVEQFVRKAGVHGEIRPIEEIRCVLYYKGSKWRTKRKFGGEFVEPAGSASDDSERPAARRLERVAFEEVVFNGEFVSRWSDRRQLIHHLPKNEGAYPGLIDLDLSLAPWEQALEIGPPPEALLQEDMVNLRVRNDEHGLVLDQFFDPRLGYAAIRVEGTKAGKRTLDILYHYGPQQPKDSVPTSNLVFEARMLDDQSTNIDLRIIEKWEHQVDEEMLQMTPPEGRYVEIDRRFGDAAEPRVVGESPPQEFHGDNKGSMRWTIILINLLAITIISAVVIWRRMKRTKESSVGPERPS